MNTPEKCYSYKILIPNAPKKNKRNYFNSTNDNNDDTTIDNNVSRNLDEEFKSCETKTSK